MVNVRALAPRDGVAFVDGVISDRDNRLDICV
jgi:hypothetical protein